MALLQDTFPVGVIACRCDINWQPRSCDLTSHFLWGYVKDRVYADKPSTHKQLKTYIRQVMAEILPSMCQKVVENYFKIITACNTSHEGHLND